METLVFMVIGLFFLGPIRMHDVALITAPTTKQISETRTLNPIVKTKPTVPSPTSCPSSFTYNNTFLKCYYVHNVTLNFNNANDTCVGLGGSLVMPKTTDEQAFVAQMIPGGTSTIAYVGIKYRTIGGIPAYYYLDGTPFSLCTYLMTTPYSSYPVMSIRKSDSCFTNWSVTGTRLFICEATPF